MNSSPPKFTLYRDPQTRRVLSRYLILLKWFREHKRISHVATRITQYTMRTDEQAAIIQQAVKHFGLIPFNAESRCKSAKQLKLKL